MKIEDITVLDTFQVGVFTVKVWPHGPSGGYDSVEIYLDEVPIAAVDNFYAEGNDGSYGEERDIPATVYVHNGREEPTLFHYKGETK